jgi:hypothetical protein
VAASLVHAECMSRTIHAEQYRAFFSQMPLGSRGVSPSALTSLLFWCVFNYLDTPLLRQMVHPHFLTPFSLMIHQRHSSLGLRSISQCRFIHSSAEPKYTMYLDASASYSYDIFFLVEMHYFSFACHFCYHGVQCVQHE